MFKLRDSAVKAAKGLTRRVINSAGYDLSRKRSPSRLLAPPITDTRGTILEFVGPSGIGKSTLCAEFYAAIGKNWFSKEDLDDLILQDLDYPEDLQKDLNELLLRKAIRHCNADDLWVAAGKLKYASFILEKDLLMRRVFSRGFIIDEGLFHNFSRDIIKLSPDSLRRLASGRALVFVEASSGKTVAERYMERYRQRSARGFKHPTSFQQVEEESDSYLSTFRSLYQAVSKICPCLRINVEDGFEENLRQVKAFEAGLKERMKKGSFDLGQSHQTAAKATLRAS